MLQGLKTLNNMGFSSSSPTQNDPLFIHMRIKSENKVIYDNTTAFNKRENWV